MHSLIFRKKRISYLLTALFIICIINICAADFLGFGKDRAKNVILMIGDGMGLAQISATQGLLEQSGQSLILTEFSTIGLYDTSSLNSIVTDSAAAATAMATGYKTNNGMISMLPDGTPLKTILELCQEQEKSVGLVATSEIFHATPAAFGAHANSRKEYFTIASQLIDHKIDVLMGGGKTLFQNSPPPEAGTRKNLLQKALELGYHLASSADDLETLHDTPFLGLFADKAFTRKSISEPTLAEMTGKAITLLSENRKGFFLMVEGSQIDWAAHDNDSDRFISEMLDFDAAVSIAHRYAKEHKNTLVIVVGDHETGALAVGKDPDDAKKPSLMWNSKGHTGILMPLFAFGAGAEKFCGFHDNTDIAKLILEAMNLEKELITIRK